MSDQALVVGGTRFTGRHLVEHLLAHDYRVATGSRGETADPFADRDGVTSLSGDRTDPGTPETARDAADPDIVIDTCAYFPRDVEAATEVFADVEAYVYVSSGSSNDAPDVPMGVTRRRFTTARPRRPPTTPWNATARGRPRATASSRRRPKMA